MGPGRNNPTLSRCPHCHDYFTPAELLRHEPSCPDNPASK